MSDRIPCINTRCRRTAPADKYEPNTEIICRTCMKNLPPKLRDRFKQLRKRERQLKRAWKKRGENNPALPIIWDQIDKNWVEIKESFHSEKPEGLENFLNEIGIK